jgi:NADP-dependent alcohol dehydrogenase
LTEYEGDRAQAINDIMQQLELHGAVQLGENQAITLTESRAILEKSVA